MLAKAIVVNIDLLVWCRIEISGINWHRVGGKDVYMEEEAAAMNDPYLRFPGLLTKLIYFLDILLACKSKCGSLSGQELFLPVLRCGVNIASVG